MYTYALFPELLDLAPIGVTVLRVAAGALFLTFGGKLVRAALDTPRETSVWTRAFGWLYASVPLALGVLFVAGLYTQGAALVGFFLSLYTHTTLKRTQAPVSAKHLHSLLAAVCAALLFLGAGLFSIDLPL